MNQKEKYINDNGLKTWGGVSVRKGRSLYIVGKRLLLKDAYGYIASS